MEKGSRRGSACASHESVAHSCFVRGALRRLQRPGRLRRGRVPRRRNLHAGQPLPPGPPRLRHWCVRRLGRATRRRDGLRRGTALRPGRLSLRLPAGRGLSTRQPVRHRGDGVRDADGRGELRGGWGEARRCGLRARGRLQRRRVRATRLRPWRRLPARGPVPHRGAGVQLGDAAGDLPGHGCEGRRGGVRLGTGLPDRSVCRNHLGARRDGDRAARVRPGPVERAR